jgi:putative transposase
MIYPYLLGGLVIERPIHAWTSDTTYLPMVHGFMYRVAILDIAGRKVLAFEFSNTFAADFCVAAFEQALAKFRPPKSSNTDQVRSSPAKPGSSGRGVAISMKVKGRLDRKHLYRAAVAERERRGGPSPRLCLGE